MSKFLKLNAVCFSNGSFRTERIVLNSDFIIGFYPECNIKDGENIEDFVARTLDIDASMILLKKDAIEIVDYQCERAVCFLDIFKKYEPWCPVRLDALCEGSNYLWVINSDDDLLAQLNK